MYLIVKKNQKTIKLIKLTYIDKKKTKAPKYILFYRNIKKKKKQRIPETDRLTMQTSLCAFILFFGVALTL